MPRLEPPEPIERFFTVESGENVARFVPMVESPTMRRLYEMATRGAAGPINWLVTGESGVGKKTLARWIHTQSPRRRRPLIIVKCASAENGLAKAMFGSGRTTKKEAYPGAFEIANGGTIVLGDVDALDLECQGRLRRMIETREIMRIDESTPRPVDVRIISTSSADLEAATRVPTFRFDLFCRLSALQIRIPTLRERPEEIEALTRHFLAEATEGARIPELSTGVLDLFRSFVWPGNLIQLRNVIARAWVLCTGPEIMPKHIDVERLRSEGPSTAGTPTQDGERQRIIDALVACRGRATRDPKPK